MQKIFNDYNIDNFTSTVEGQNFKIAQNGFS